MVEMSESEINDLLNSAPIGRLAMADPEGKPYVIPMPFCWLSGALYLRLPMKGRKASILENNNKVCFEADTFTTDLTDYASVIIEGTLMKVDDLGEKGSVKAANDAKYNRLRNGNRPGHGRITPIEELPLQRIRVLQISGRKKTGAH